MTITTTTQDVPVLAAHDVAVSFRDRHSKTRGARIQAVDGVSIELHRGQTFGLLGESGSGKSTLGRALLLLQKCDRGTIAIDGHDLWKSSSRERRRLRRRMQMVFQDPFSSFDPSVALSRSMREPLEVHESLSRLALTDRVEDVVEAVGLTPRHLDRSPRELSGGQLQRLAIARALTLNPDVLVLDEPVSALDMSTQAQIINLLVDLQADRGLSYLFISHNPAVVHHVSHRIGVMRTGRLVEVGDATDVYERPEHEYSQALMAAALSGDPTRRQHRAAG